jgi:hypothetical protein
MPPGSSLLAKEVPLPDVLLERSRLLFPDAVVQSGTIPKLFSQLAELGHAGSKKQSESTVPTVQH